MKEVVACVLALALLLMLGAALVDIPSQTMDLVCQQRAAQRGFDLPVRYANSRCEVQITASDGAQLWVVLR